MPDKFHLEQNRSWDQAGTARGRTLEELAEALNNLRHSSKQISEQSDAQKWPALEEYFAQRREFEKLESLKRKQSFGVCF